MKKKLIFPALVAVGSIALGVGATFALFSSNESSRAELEAGVVKVNFENTMTKALSRFADDTPYNAMAHAGDDNLAVFENGGTASIVSTTGDSTKLVLDRISPMDMVSFKATATNASNINIKFRYFVKLEGELLPALQVKIDGTEYATPTNGKTIYSLWSQAMTPDVESLFVKDVSVYFPYEASVGVDQNSFQGKQCSIEIGIEAIQGNATVVDEISEDPSPAYETIHSPDPTDENKTVVMPSSNGEWTAIVGGGAVDNNPETELSYTFSLREEPAAPIGAGSQCESYDVSFTGIKEGNTEPIIITRRIGAGKQNVKVYHNGEEIPSQYDEVTGYVTFTVTNFSPFDFVWDAPRETSYGFYDSYKVDEGLDTEHWVHEITCKDEFQNIVDSSVHDSKAGAYAYPGAHDENTVYLIKNDIDFGGLLWDTDQLVSEVNAYPFIGHLVGDNEGVTLSNIHVTEINGGVDTGSMFCVFGRAVNASFEKLTLSDCTVSNDGGDKCALLCGGNKTASYTDILGNDFVVKYIEFKDILIDETCSLKAGENGGGVCAVLRFYTDHILFNNCTNKASIFTPNGNNGGILGQMSQNPTTKSHATPAVLRNCVNVGQIQGNGNYVGGLIGHYCTNSPDSGCFDCANYGVIKQGSTSTVGSIIGGNSAGYGPVLNNCTNAGMIYSKGTAIYDFQQGNKVLYEEKGADEVSETEFKEIFLNGWADKEIGASIDKDNKKIVVDTNDGADHYTMQISAFKVDIDTATNKAVPQRSGSIMLHVKENLTSEQIKDYALINQLGYFAPGPGECPVDEYHGGLNIGTRAEFVTSTYFLDYSLHGQEGYEAGYGVNSKGGYCIVDNTGNTTGYWACLLTFRQNIRYQITGYDKDGNVVSSGYVVYAPYSLGGNNNYTTEIVGYTPDVL
mgnify:CR=1 FL=1